MSVPHTKDLDFKRIFYFWLPLAGTWLMMSVEGPYLSAIIARLPEPKFNLAAYGVAFSFALILEAPIIMIMSASTALAKSRMSFIRLRNFTYFLNLLLTGVMVVFLIPPIFEFVSMDLIGLPFKVAHLTHKATILMLPWPAAIGYRRFYQGILIRSNLTRRVAYGTVIRLFSMSLTAFLLYLFAEIDGVLVGALALSCGVTTEALASKLMALKAVREFESSDELSSDNISYKEIYSFYYPLALTSILGLGVHPIVTFFMGQSRMPLESLAVLPVINSLVFIFRSVGLSFQEVVIALIGDNLEGYKILRNFALLVGTAIVMMLGLIAYTPLADVWFIHVSGLSETLSDFAKLPLMIIFVIPGLTFLISFQRAMLVHEKNTRPITLGTVTEVLTIITVLLFTIKMFDWVGAVAAMCAFVIGRLAANILLTVPFKNVLKKHRIRY